VTAAAPPAWRWQIHDVLASTQDTAIAAAQAGDPGRLAVLAHRQSAGRGSRGRSWTSPEGNLNLSALLRPDAAQEPGRWALLAGVALHTALAPHANGLILKWPNDLLLDGAKLGGILIDSQWAADGGVAWVVIGLGANLARAPDVAGRHVACLPAPAPRARMVAAAVLTALDAHLGADTEAICEAWLARAHPVGTMLDVRTPRQRVEGAFQGLTARGELRLGGVAEPISSGEVFL
jgi:BirA family biotin operon repressor/biotin-[acetyl-CoA-carboxylase] ligase